MWHNGRIFELEIKALPAISEPCKERPSGCNNYVGSTSHRTWGVFARVGCEMGCEEVYDYEDLWVCMCNL